LKIKHRIYLHLGYSTQRTFIKQKVFIMNNNNIYQRQHLVPHKQEIWSDNRDTNCSNWYIQQTKKQ